MGSEMQRLTKLLRESHETPVVNGRLSGLTHMARKRLAEQAATRPQTEARIKEAPSEDVPADCLKAANGFREAIKDGDALEEAAEAVAKHAKEVAASSDPVTAKRGAMDVEASTVKLKQAVDGLYGAYAEARKAFYAVALAWDMYSPPATAKKGPSSDIKALSEKEMADQIAYASKTLQTNVKDFLEKAATASKHFRNAAKKLGLEKGEMTADEKKALIDAAFAARTASEPLFGRTQGIARRAVELVARAKEREKFEAKGKRLKIELAVEDDPELGGLDLV